MTQQHVPVGVPGGRPISPIGSQPAGDQPTESLLQGVEDQLDQLDGQDLQDQVPAFDRMHTALADALARTADTGGPPAPGQPGA